MSNLFSTVVPLASYYLTDSDRFFNQIVAINFAEEFGWFKLNLDYIQLEKAEGFSKKSLKFVPGTESIHLQLGDFDFGVLLFGKILVFNLFEIDFSETEIWFSKMSVDIVAEMNSNDGYAWQLDH